MVPFSVLLPEITIVVIRDNNRIVVLSGSQNKPIVIGTNELIANIPRRRVYEVIALLELVQNIAARRRTPSIGHATPEPRHKRLHVLVASVYEIVNHYSDSHTRENLLTFVCLNSMPKNINNTFKPYHFVIVAKYKLTPWPHCCHRL
jgi:hypothetical protein